jgi:hypothetical protein
MLGKKMSICITKKKAKEKIKKLNDHPGFDKTA